MCMFTRRICGREMPVQGKENCKRLWKGVSVASHPGSISVRPLTRNICACEWRINYQIHSLRVVIPRNRGNIDTMQGWLRAETPEASSYLWCLAPAESLTNQKWLLVEWIGASKPGWFLDMKYHTCSLSCIAYSCYPYIQGLTTQWCVTH